MSRGENFQKRGKCKKKGHCNTSSGSVWSDLNANGAILKLRDMCSNQKCRYQKQITFTPRQLEMEGGCLKSFMKKVFEGSNTAWSKFLKPAVNAAAPVIGMAVAAK